MADEILFVRVKKESPSGLSPGDWFFDTGMWAMCGEMSEAPSGQCSLILRFAPSSAPDVCDKRLVFPNIQETFAFVEKIFGRPVRRVRPSQMPKPEVL